MKNKYQEALDIIKETLLHEHLFDEDKWNEVNDVMKPYFSTIQKLIDKETPMKPVEGTLCGNCKSPLVTINFKFLRCLNPQCEQKVDWSKDDE